MKKYFLLFVLGMAFITSAYAQSASATWTLTSDTASIVSGNITAPAQVLKGNRGTKVLCVRDYLGGYTANPPNPLPGYVQRVWIDTSWPVEASPNYGRYLQYSVSPLEGNNFTIQNISLELGCSGATAKFYVDIAWSTDTTFSSATTLISGFLIGAYDVRTAASLATLSYTLNSVINSSETFYVRIYPYLNAYSTSSGKYVCVRNLIISGSATLPNTPTIIVTPPSLSFGNVDTLTTKEMSYVLSGVILTPENDSISISAPNGFEVSTTSVSGFSSSLKIPYTGGALSTTTIYVRFSPTIISNYSGEIIHTGGGTPTQAIPVTGRGVIHYVGIGVYVSTTGSDSSSGTFDQPFRTIPKAISVAQAGDTIYVFGGTYLLNTTINISKKGNSSSKYCLFSYPGKRPVLDFTSMTYSSSNRGINLSGSYWYIKGIDIRGAGDNGMYIGGSYNEIEFCSLYENRDSGLQLGSGASNNRVINCDSYFNFDSLSTNPGENADGFAPKLDVGSDNCFYGCRSWQNTDDGWDCFGAVASVTIENCWTYGNGYTKDWIDLGPKANGNGFKVGGNNTENDAILKNCLAFGNKSKGFDQNHNMGSMTFYNCTGHGNGGDNYSVSEDLHPGKTLTLVNCVELGDRRNIWASAIQTTNSWMGSLVVDTSDFISLDTTGVRGPRKSDGSLPEITFMHLAEGSDLINAGTDVGLPFISNAPDLGYFESSIITAIAGDLKTSKPASFQLSQNFPNPFNPTTVIHFSVAKKGMAKLTVVNILGQEIATLFAGNAEPGKIYPMQFNAASLPSGVYFSVLASESERQVKKMLLIK